MCPRNIKDKTEDVRYWEIISECVESSGAKGRVVVVVAGVMNIRV